MSCESQDRDQRSCVLAVNMIVDYKAGKISLKRLVDGLDDVWNYLDVFTWSEEFRGRWWTLEQIYAVALDRGELDSLSPESLVALEEAIAGIKSLLDLWQSANSGGRSM